MGEAEVLLFYKEDTRLGYHDYTAILVDGGFFRRRYYSKFGERDPKEVSKFLFEYCLGHLEEKHIQHKLYRIFYYDCPPLEGNIFHPLTQKDINFSKTPQFKWTNDFYQSLSSKRKVSIRLGKMSENGRSYNLKSDRTKKLLKGAITVSNLTEEDFSLSTIQKGVDMRIGLDIASLSFKKQVGQIVLISGDSDFVPAAKLARREGVDFILDPLGSGISKDLFEHIDGIRSIRSYFR